MPSFDIVSETDLQEVDNAVNQAAKEIGTRYDFRGSKSEITREEAVIKVVSDDDYKLEQVIDVLKARLTRRKVDARALEMGKVEPAAGGMVRQEITVLQGVPQEKAKAMVKIIKASKIKVQAAIQGEQVRVSGKKRDDLQSVMALVKKEVKDLPLQFTNYRD